MATIKLESGGAFTCGRNDVILRAGLRQGVAIPYECNSGGCGACKIQVLEGDFEVACDESPGLSERDRRKNRQLACQCRPKTDCRIKVRTDDRYLPRHAPARQTADLVKVEPVTHDILEFHFELEHGGQFIPGQYAMVRVNGLDERAYSMANLPNDEKILVFQIRKVPGGKTTSCLFDERERKKASFEIDGPFGMAFLRHTDKDIVCVAGGSGLAPMLSIARGVVEDPAFAGRRVWFFHGGREEKDLFDHEKMRALSGLGERLEYFPATSERPANNHETHMGDIHEVVARTLDDRLSHYEIYCAGPPGMVNALDALVRENGAHHDSIHFDRFY